MFDPSKPLHQSLEDQCVATRAIADDIYRDYLSEIERFLDAQFELLDLTFWTTHSDEFSGRGPAQTILYSALHKNAFLFFASVDLTRRGLYGPACTLLRPVLEALAIAKYCALSNDTTVFETWRSGEYVSLTNQVLNRIGRPGIGEVRRLWKGLNNMAHASIYSQQISSDFGSIKKELHNTLVIIRMLLVFNYHLLTRHFLTPTTLYYTGSYGDKAKLDSARQRAREMARQIRKSFAKDGRQFLRECCASWQLKPVKKPGQPSGRG
jgi:hypothetical protein